MTTTAADPFRHPHYVALLPDWEVMAHTYEGERCVKDQGDRYLPPTSGMVANGYGQPGAGPKNLGQKAYDAYRMRAVFHEFVKEAVVGMLGIIHRKPPKYTVPKALEPIIASASIAGESMNALWRRITEAQLTMGRCGLLLDVPDGVPANEALPFVAFYRAPAVVNWDDGIRAQGRRALELVVLDESSYERKQGLQWEYVTQYRVLAMSEVAASLGATNQDAPAAGEYVAGLARLEGNTGSLNLAQATFRAPHIAGRTLGKVPFVFVNTNDLVPEPCVPPLLGLARLSLAIYRGEADYRHSLHLQGQDTLVRIGATEEQQQVMTGAGAVIDLPMSGDAKYIGVSSSGLGEQRSALENDKAQASIHSVRMLDTKSGEAESGEALRVRVSARTATLASLQLTAAQAVTDVLKLAAQWMGLSPKDIESIQVEPNTDFADAEVQAAAVKTLMESKTLGLPLSMRSMHEWLRKHEFTTKEFDDEMQEIAEEMATLGIGGVAERDIDPEQDDEEEEAAA